MLLHDSISHTRWLRTMSERRFTPRLRWLFWAASASIFVIGLAGVLKLLDLEAFRSSLQLWTLLPSWSVSLALLIVAVAEVALLGLWLSAPRARPMVAGFCLAVLGLFSVLFAAQSALSEDGIPCGCFGALVPDLEFSSSLRLVLARNLAIAIPLALWLCFARSMTMRKVSA